MNSFAGEDVGGVYGLCAGSSAWETARRAGKLPVSLKAQCGDLQLVHGWTGAAGNRNLTGDCEVKDEASSARCSSASAWPLIYRELFPSFRPSDTRWHSFKLCYGSMNFPTSSGRCVWSWRHDSRGNTQGQGLAWWMFVQLMITKWTGTRSQWVCLWQRGGCFMLSTVEGSGRTPATYHGHCQHNISRRY